MIDRTVKPDLFPDRMAENCQETQVQIQRSLEPPVLTFGVPVRNGERVLPRLLNSLLAQDFTNFEIIICDNDSSDRTAAICQTYATKDERIRFYRNPENVGINRNFNRVLQLARGEYFRWVGADDWLESNYASECLKLFEARPDAFAVTTFQDHTDEQGNQHYCEFFDRRPDSASAFERFRRMMWFLTADYRYIDPMYTMMRRQPLAAVGGLRMDVIWADHVLTMTTSLLGAFAHVPLCLSHRGQPSPTPWHPLLKRCYHDEYDRVKHQNYWHVAATFLAIAWASHLNAGEKIACILPVLHYLWMKTWKHLSQTVLEIARFLGRPLKHLVLRYMNE